MLGEQSPSPNTHGGDVGKLRRVVEQGIQGHGRTPLAERSMSKCMQAWILRDWGDRETSGV